MKKKITRTTTHAPGNSVARTTSVRHTSVVRRATKSVAPSAMSSVTSSVTSSMTPAAISSATSSAAAVLPGVSSPVATVAAAEKQTAAIINETPTETPTVIAAASSPAIATPDVARLIEAVHSTSVEASAEAVELLGDADDARAFDALAHVLANDAGYFHVVVRSAAALAMGKSRDTRVTAALQAAVDDASAEVSREAILALGALRAELRTESSVEKLIQIVENLTGYYINTTRHAAVRALGKLRNLKAQPALAALALATHEDPALTAAAREALANV
jgi:hypothetical protein